MTININKRKDMMERRMEEMPEYLKSEHAKYLVDPKKYVRLHPVIYKMLKKYLEPEKK